MASKRALTDKELQEILESDEFFGTLDNNLSEPTTPTTIESNSFTEPNESFGPKKTIIIGDTVITQPNLNNNYFTLPVTTGSIENSEPTTAFTPPMTIIGSIESEINNPNYEEWTPNADDIMQMEVITEEELNTSNFKLEERQYPADICVSEKNDKAIERSVDRDKYGNEEDLDRNLIINDNSRDKQAPLEESLRDISNNISDQSDERENMTEDEYERTDNDSQDETYKEIPKKKGKISKESRKENQYKRMRGLEYLGLKKNEDGKYKMSSTKSARNILPPCKSKQCEKFKSRFCSSFTENIRKRLFSKFWNHMTWDMRKVYIASLIEGIETKQTTVEDDKTSRRKMTYKFFLVKENKRLQVCKKMFLHTLGIKEWVAIHWFVNAENGMHVPDEMKDNPKRSRRSCATTTGKTFIVKFLTDIPKLESHYCRASSSRLYLEPIYRTKMDVYRVYKEQCGEKDIKALVPKIFFEEMDKQKIAIYQPKKDQCDICVSHKEGNVGEEEFLAHQQRKIEARDAKAEDKTLASSRDDILIYTLDMQAVKLAPYLLASAIYYKTKLCIHNYTLYNLSTKDVYCYLWHEGEGGLDANVFATILLHHLEEQLNRNKNIKTIILYSDGCGYQNRNNTLANALLYFSKKMGVTVIQIFLEKGHTQMEVDAAHSLIERKLKKREIYVPTDYVNVCAEARPSQPFNVKYLSHDFFKSFDAVKYYQTIRPGTRRGDPTINNIRCIKYDTDIMYKLNFTEEWKALPKKLASENIQYYVPSRLYKGPLKIKLEKYNHLQQLKAVLNDVYWSFYDNLPH